MDESLARFVSRVILSLPDTKMGRLRDKIKALPFGGVGCGLYASEHLELLFCHTKLSIYS